MPVDQFSFLRINSENMNFRQLRYFCEVVDGGTLARAAERLYVAPTAISMQIAQLEGSVGGTLFDRSAKPMTLTPLGHYFLPRARELLRLGQRLEDDARDMAQGRRGWLSIGFVRSLLYSVLPLAIRRFRERHPNVKLELVELLSEHQTTALRQHRIHIGLSRFARPIEPPNDLRHAMLFDDPYVAAVPSANPIARARAPSMSELAALPFIAFPKDPASSYASQVMTMLHSAGVSPQIAHEAIEVHTALGLVAAGLGFQIVTPPSHHQALAGHEAAEPRGLLEARYTAAPAISSGSPMRRSGVPPATVRARASGRCLGVGVLPQRLGEVGLDQARRDAVDAHVVRAVFVRQVARQLHVGGLADAVGADHRCCRAARRSTRR
jgi:DNA-binding transcriptional LysR family regulator